MFKVLLIDDERPVRQAVRALGHWESLGIGEIQEAAEGESALQIMRESQPDIVLLDMKMPVMSGMEFLAIASQEFPVVQYIVLSGFDDFEFTRQAIKSHALDYLLKPVVETELNAALEKAVHELHRLRELTRSNLSQERVVSLSMPLLKERLVSSIIESDQRSVLTAEYQTLLKLGGPEHVFGIALLHILDQDQVCANLFLGDLQTMHFAITNVIDEMLALWPASFSFRNNRLENEIVLLIVMPAGQETALMQSCSVRLNTILAKLREIFGIRCLAALGPLHQDFGRLHDSYETAARIIRRINLLTSHDQVFLEIGQESRREPISLLERRDLLLNAFKSGSLDHVRNILREYLDKIAQLSCFTLEDLQIEAMSFLVTIESILKQMGIHDRSLSTFKHSRQGFAISSLAELSIFIFSLAERVVVSSASGHGENVRTDLHEIRNYIDNHYSQDIQLSFFSGKYCLNKNYISKQFKNEFGFGIYEYLLKVRMEKAKELVSNPDIKIQTIAEILGYNDNNYFSRAFKIYTGLSPSEYRERQAVN